MSVLSYGVSPISSKVHVLFLNISFKWLVNMHFLKLITSVQNVRNQSLKFESSNDDSVLISGTHSLPILFLYFETASRVPIRYPRTHYFLVMSLPFYHV
jgi:hypothetical protein